MANKPGPPSLIGQTLGQFQIKDELGRGGMAVVYKGYQPSLDRWVAIKTLPVEMSADREMVSRFHREAEAMVTLNHTNIVQIIDKGEDKGLYYFAMEFVEGPSLKDLLKEPELSIELLFDIATQVCDGLAYAHKKGIIHRDIKPANILWEKGTQLAKVADFGIARVSNKDLEMITLTANNVGMGTMNYMAPEQKTAAHEVDHRADMYSLGVMIYEMFTGKLPLGKFKLPSELNPKLPRKLDELVNKCLETDPADRYPSLEELRVDLQAAREQAKGGSVVRSVRDAAERTLTAMKEGGGGGKAVAALGCLALGVGALGVGGFAVKKLVIDKGTIATGTETQPPGTEKRPPATEKGTERPATERPPTGTDKPATERRPSTEKQPPATEKQPVTERQPPATERQPATEKQPPATEKQPPATEKQPPATERQPPATERPATERQPPATETTSPQAVELTRSQRERYDQERERLHGLTRTVRDCADRGGVQADVDKLLQAAATLLDDGEALKNQGKPSAIQRLEEGYLGLRNDAGALFADLAGKRLREATAVAGPAQAERLREAERTYEAAADKRPEEQPGQYADVLNLARRVLVEGTREAARLAIVMARVRGAGATAAAEKAHSDGAAAERSRPDEALARFKQARDLAMAVRGPTPRSIKFITRQKVADVSGLPGCKTMFTIAPAPDGRVVGLGRVDGEGETEVHLVLFDVGPSGVTRAGPSARVDKTMRFVAPAGDGCFWLGHQNGRIQRFRLQSGRLEQDGPDLVMGDKPLYDLDVAPDGRLLAVGKSSVTAYDGTSMRQVGAPVQFGERTFAAWDIPRRLACLPGGGWILSGETRFAGAAPTERTSAWNAEDQGQWIVELRVNKGGAEAAPSKREGLAPLAVAACGEGALIVTHGQRSAFHLLQRDTLMPNPEPLPLEGQASLYAQDVAVTGKWAVVLDVRVKDDPEPRRCLAVYEIKP